MGGTGFPALRTATFLSVGDGQHLNHEYQFNLALPQARTAFQRTLAFLAQVTR